LLRCEALCSSAAEKRDYAVISGHRQLLFRLTATLISALQRQHIDLLGISTVVP
jgi:hypothetical protein